MYVGETTTVRAEITQNITNAPLEWKCSNANIGYFTVGSGREERVLLLQQR